MGIDLIWWLALSVIIPFLLYGLTRLVSLAWYRSKFDSLRRLTHGTDKEE